MTDTAIGDYAMLSDRHSAALVALDRSIDWLRFPLKEGHLFGRKEVAVPIAAVASVTTNGIRLSVSKHEVSALPAIDVRRPGR